MNWHPFNDSQNPGDQGRLQNILHAIRGGVMGGNEYRVLNMPRARVYRVTALGTNSGSPGQVPWDTADYDTDGFWTGADPTKLTVRTSGVYIVYGVFGWTANINGLRQIILWVNGGAVIYETALEYDALGVGSRVDSTWLVACNAGTTLELRVNQSSGASPLAALVGPSNASLACCMISTL